MNDYGLVPALPTAFFIALGLLATSFTISLSRSRVSPVRLGLHVAVLILMLHGVVPLVFASPAGDSVYKHIGVVQSIVEHGSLNGRVDIYQNWPGFFALAAWFDSIAGVGSPIDYASWAPVYINVLAVLAMAVAMRALTTSARLRWAALFIFVATNWVGQDYFSPQAYGFVVGLAVVACLITWFRSDRPAAWVKSLADRVHGLLRAPSTSGDDPSSAEMGDRQRTVLLLAINVGFAAVTFSHQLSPFMVLAGVMALTIAGAVRPRWLVFGPIVISALYVATRLGYLISNHAFEFSLNAFGNAHNQSVGLGQGTAGRLFTATTARVLTLGMWSLGALGILRRLRQGAPVLVPTLLMTAPAALLFANDYGGEAIYRVFLFSLPWTAFLAAAALVPTGPWSIWSGVRLATALCVMLGLFLQAYFGLEQINQMRPDEVAASQYFEARAASGSVLILAAPNFPQRSTGSYDQFIVPSGDFDPSLTSVDRFQRRMLTAADLPDIESVVVQYERRPNTGYLAITTAMKVYSHLYSLLPDGSLDSLDRALASSPDWRLFYRNKDAVIYQLVASPPIGGSAGNQPGGRPLVGDSPP
jgi:hypothetical protein